MIWESPLQFYRQICNIMAILTVYTELLDNTLSGARIIDMGTQRSCACFVLPKDKVAEVGAKHKWVKQHSFYILLGTHPNTGKRTGYVGETNDFTHRVIDHKQKKEYWDTALVFISKSNEIYKMLKNVARIIDYPDPEEIELKGWIVRSFDANGIDIKDDALTLLLEYIGDDQARLSQEIDKLSSYVGKGGTIRKEDIKLLVPKNINN